MGAEEGQWKPDSAPVLSDTQGRPPHSLPPGNSLALALDQNKQWSQFPWHGGVSQDQGPLVLKPRKSQTNQDESVTVVWTASQALCQRHCAMSPLCLLSSPCWHGSKSPSSQVLTGLKPTTLALRFPPPHPGLVSRCPEFPLPTQPQTGVQMETHSEASRGPGQRQRESKLLASPTRGLSQGKSGNTLCWYLPVSVFCTAPCVSAAGLGIEEGGQDPAVQRDPPGYLCPGKSAE